MLEQIGSCDSPIFVFAFDGSAISNINFFQRICQSQAIACAHLQVAEKFKSHSEVPRDVAFLLIDKFLEIVFANQESESRTGCDVRFED